MSLALNVLLGRNNMEIQLQELIDQIKKDGVEEAQKQADAILLDAKNKAQKIVADAEAQAEKLLATAKLENEKMVKSSEDAIRQAGRNLLISFRESIAKQLNAIVNEQVNGVYSKEGLAKIITSVIENWTNKPEAEDISVLVNSADLKELEEGLLGFVKEKLLKGVTLKANDNFDGGFRIANQNGGAYYDYSTEAVVQMLSNYLSPKVTALLKEAE